MISVLVPIRMSGRGGLNTGPPQPTHHMADLPEFLPGCFYLVEYADLARAQVVFSPFPLSADQAAIEAEEILWRQLNEAPSPGERVRVSGPYLVDQDQTRRYILLAPLPGLPWQQRAGDIFRSNRPTYRPLDDRGD